MEKEKKQGSVVFQYLLLVLLFWIFSVLMLNFVLKQYSIEYERTGSLTIGYVLYALIGMVFSTPAPFLSVLIISLFIQKTGFRAFVKGLFRTENKKRAAVLTSAMCLMALVFALLCAKRNSESLIMMPLGFLVMIPFVGIAEEAGWRGLLQPEMEKRFPFPVSVLIVAAIWYVWHFDLWLDPTSNHYGDSLIGFGITIFIWSFSLAALYKGTKSVFCCAIYHAFIDSIGAIYDWNSLFDSFPGNIGTNVFRLIWLVSSVVLYIYFDRKEKSQQDKE